MDEPLRELFLLGSIILKRILKSFHRIIALVLIAMMMGMPLHDT